jgi:hypothetical protein
MPDLAISAIDPNDANAREFRRIQKYGLSVNDFLAISGTKAYPGFGSGNDYTVANWISSGAFANLAAVQAVYPICQATTDYVDWVIIQSAIDFTIYGSLGNGNRAATKRILRLPAGNFKINRSLHIGYGALGTPPANLNGNGYVTITIEGEGSQYDSSGNGMTGTTITTTATSFNGINVTRGVGVVLRDFTLQGNYDGYIINQDLHRAPDNWNVQAYRRTSPAIADANWIDGQALNVGICMSPYTESGSAAAYPARVLPSYFGGGTSTAQTGSVGGSGLLMENVNIFGFIVGTGRPYGDQNDEYIYFHGGEIRGCVYACVTRHSQNRNMSFRDCRIEAFHTAFSAQGGPNLSDNGNLHGSYDNIHFGRGYQIIDHKNGGWTGPIVFRSAYAESFCAIGRCEGRSLKFVDSYLSFIEIEGNNGVPPYHFKGTKLILDHTMVGITRHGLMTGSFSFNDPTEVVMINGSIMDTLATSRNNPAGTTFNGHPNLTQIVSGLNYMRSVFALPGRGSQIINDRDVSEYGPNLVNTNRSDEVIDTHIQQEWTQFYSQYPRVADLVGSNEMHGSVQSFRVPKVSAYQFGGLNVTARSGYDLTCSRVSFGDIKMDVGDIIMLDPNAPDITRAATWFIIVSISGSIVMRQLNNFDSTNGTNYFTNGWNQIEAGWSGQALWICTRIKQNHRLWVGDVTSGSNVITNVKHAFRFGATDDFTTGTMGMQVGDLFLHQEIERANTGGSGLKVTNPVTAIDYAANTITLTNNFNITQTNYPIVFFVDVHNA